MLTSYNSQEIEKKWWQFWLKGRWFHAKVDKQKKAYTILIPPPNVTNKLHMGHGLNNTLQDILIRWKRMCGFNAMWLPGTDHAGIATQMMVERALEKEGKSRKDIGRESFFKRCQEWKDTHGSLIINQLQRLGFSCDWERESYTMDPKLSQAVRAVFVDLFNQGYIYRGERLVNWDVVLQTAISDDEVENKEVQGNLWLYKYRLESSAEFVTVATTRPETMFGDVAIAVHPEDERYKHYIGKKAVIPFLDRKIPIISDNYVKPEFGTGCVKITPAHDPNDFLIGQRHQLPSINIMNEDGTLNENNPERFKGLDRFDARKKIVIALKEEKLMVEIKSYKQVLPYSERSKSIVEPRLSKQWFVKMTELAKPAIESAKKNELSFFPESHKKTYLHWLENIEDWCISRQLWWGHQIPVWYCQDCYKHATAIEDLTNCPHCGSEHLERDSDVLDTWFSSWLWPISPFGWPNKSPEQDYFFPSSVIVTGSDIIFLWVARMIMASHYLKGEIPFKDIYLHATICDKQGRKFSKTLGNGIDPIEMINKHGADAVRYVCVNSAPLGGRIKMSVEDFEHGSRLIQKIWNASKFVLSHLKKDELLVSINESQLDLPTKWLIHEFRLATGKINNYLSSYQFQEATDSLFHFIWRSFCDWSIESSKEILNGKNEKKRLQLCSALVYVLDGMMRLISPFMPFISEEIWQQLPSHPLWDRKETLVVSCFPQVKNIPSFESDHKHWDIVQELVGHIRSLRTQSGVPPKEKVDAHIQCDDNIEYLFKNSEQWTKALSGVKSFYYGSELQRPSKSLVATGKTFSLYVPVGKYLDFDKERQRLLAEKGRIEKLINSLKGKLKNNNFLLKAPKKIVSSTKAQLFNLEKQWQVLEDNISAID